ncbi:MULTISPECIES: flagellar basal body P-ring formation chaperone FlgA [unclassified Thiomonas]|jgi:flagella basal body P-ring formation protein FlgA|uniref:flagellar basal body P-ring formation chaperone FlgA n=1 Tax=unclassified Thiomonas TaxID=2625466 RepID=UPI000BCE4123|nr:MULTISPECIES: flagellar basal body P-ring formation chaperone FlgA [unclassified Thiomonas]OZB69980.1 MAG: flagella basal body P-ring formation protein FlgA [Thiomonas sp. 13-64-67]
MPIRLYLFSGLRLLALAWVVNVSLGVATFAWAVPAAESPATIRAAVEAFVRAGLPPGGEKVKIDVQGPAPGLRFPQCADLHTAYFGNANPYGAQTVEVRCTAPSVWSLYLPVRVDRPQGVVVVARALQAGHVLTAADLTMVERDATRLPPGAVTDAQALVGQVLRYSVAAGQPLAQSMLTGPQLVHYGQSVSLIAQGMGVRLVALGQAMADGRVGQSVLVRNVQSGRVVSGIVDTQGQVVVPLQ